MILTKLGKQLKEGHLLLTALLMDEVKALVTLPSGQLSKEIDNKR